MKFTMCGFSQPAAVDLDLDVRDLGILRWFIDFRDSGNMVSKEIDGEIFYLVSYNALAEDITVLHMKRDAIYRRFKKMCDKKILEKRVVAEDGNLVYFRTGENYAQLVDFSFIDEFIKNKNSKKNNDHIHSNEDIYPDGDYIFNDIVFFEDDTFSIVDYDSKNVDNSATDLNQDGTDLNPDSIDLNPHPNDINPSATNENPKLTNLYPKVSVQYPEQKINLLNYSIKLNTLDTPMDPFKEKRYLFPCVSCKLLKRMCLIFHPSETYKDKYAQNQPLVESG